MISYQVDTPEEAKKILDSVDAEFNFSRVQDTPEKVYAHQIETLKACTSHSSGAQFDRPNVDPGVSSITKIGTKTKEEILYAIKHDHTPLARFEEHYRLLWSRGEIKYDGEKYYL